MKTCIKCGQTKEATTEYFQIDKRLSTGLTGKCRLCINEYYRDYANKKKIDNSSIKSYIVQSNIEIVPIPVVTLSKGHRYTIQTPKEHKQLIGRVIKGEVVQATESFIAIRTKNYIESFSRWELSKYKIMEV